MPSIRFADNSYYAFYGYLRARPVSFQRWRSIWIFSVSLVMRILIVCLARTFQAISRWIEVLQRHEIIYGLLPDRLVLLKTFSDDLVTYVYFFWLWWCDQWEAIPPYLENVAAKVSIHMYCTSQGFCFIFCLCLRFAFWKQRLCRGQRKFDEFNRKSQKPPSFLRCSVLK